MQEWTAAAMDEPRNWKNSTSSSRRLPLSRKRSKAGEQEFAPCLRILHITNWLPRPVAFLTACANAAAGPGRDQLRLSMDVAANVLPSGRRRRPWSTRPEEVEGIVSFSGALVVNRHLSAPPGSKAWKGRRRRRRG